MFVVPAKAGTHNHQGLPGLASAFMDARLRGHDEFPPFVIRGLDPRISRILMLSLSKHADAALSFDKLRMRAQSGMRCPDQVRA